MNRYIVLLLIPIATYLVACGAPARTPEGMLRPDTPTAEAMRLTNPPNATATPEARSVTPEVVQPAEGTPAETPPKPTARMEPTPTETAPATPTQGPTEEQQQLLAGLESRGPAPELFNDVWLNSEPLKLADLRGQVVLLEFWTFG